MAKIDNAITIADLRNIARKRIPPVTFVPMDTGSGDGGGVRRNMDGFLRYRLNARALVDVNDPKLAVTLFGQRYAAPFGISAVGYAGNLRRHADEDLAAAAAEANIPFMLSGGSTASIEQIVKIAPDHVWQQLYAARDPKITDDMARRALDAGVKVLVYTADSPVAPLNNWLARTGIRLPAHVPLRSWPLAAWQGMTHPTWALNFVLHGGFPPLASWVPYASPGAGAAEIMALFQRQVPYVQEWSEVERLRALWPHTLVVKGLVDPEDALQAVQLGADAVTVSNHGGNKLDSMAAAIDSLPPVAATMKHEAPLLFDGGLRKGSDLVAALALGASMCFVGRATLYGVIAGGQSGARRAIDILCTELRRTMALIGCPDVAKLDRSFLHEDLTPPAPRWTEKLNTPEVGR